MRGRGSNWINEGTVHAGQLQARLGDVGERRFVTRKHSAMDIHAGTAMHWYSHGYAMQFMFCSRTHVCQTYRTRTPARCACMYAREDALLEVA